MSTQTILAGIGYAVGSYFGYPQLGAIVGSLVGAALTPTTKTQGPRLDDQKVTVSTYGAGIPTVYGNVRVGGNVVDSTDKIEVGSTTSQGKGGGTSNTSYKYFVHMAVSLCATPVDGSIVAIRKVWKDGKLIYDSSSGIPVGSALASATSPYSFLVLYQGHEDQLPDPLEELQHGIGNVPAYRGVVRVRLNAVECPGGRVPQFSFEICRGASLVSEVHTYGLAAAQTAPCAIMARGEIMQIENYPVPDSPGIRITRILNNGAVSVPQEVYPLTAAAVAWPIVPISSGDSFRVLHPYSVSGSIFAYSIVDLDNRSETEIIVGTTSSPWCILNGEYAVQDGSTIFLKYQDTAVLLPAGTVVSLPTNNRGATMYGGFLYAVTFVSGFMTLVKMDQTGAVLSTIASTVADSIGNTVRLIGSTSGITVVSVRANGAGKRPIWLVTTAWVVLCADTTVVESSGAGYEEAYVGNGFALIGPSSNGAGATQASYQMVRFNAVKTAQASVAGIISEQLVTAGLPTSAFDVTAIGDTVSGFTLTNPASARTNVSSLMMAYAIDATEENGLIRFFHRSALTPVAVVAYAELAAIEEGGTPGDPMPLARAQEAELPHTVAVSYINKDFDYQTSTEKATRQTTISKLDQTIDLPMSIGADVAATTAQRVLIDAWNERNKRNFKVSRKYAFISAGDVVTITFQDGTLIDWRLTKVTYTGVLIEWEGVPADATIYKQVVTGSAGYSPQTVQALGSPTRLQLLDIPLLRDADNNAGIYAALAGSDVANWLGAELFVGDDDTNLTTRGTVSSDAPIGFAQTVLASGPIGLIDESNIFTVSLGGDSFSTVTRDVLLSGGGEFWALGAPGRWEIGASAQGSSLGGGLFVLSRHLRGLFGTERFVGTHTATDSFVLLRIAGMLRPSMSTGDLGMSKRFRGITTGRTLQSGYSQSYTNTGEGLMPLSPINLRRATSPTNDITLSWDRRSRLSINFMTGTLPLGETTEHYSVEFWTSSAFTTLAGTLTTTTASLTITSAQQTSFGLTPGSLVFVRVRQYSDSVGVGRELQATA